MRETITIIGFVQSLFGIILFIAKRPKHLSLTLLSMWFTVIAIFLGASLLPFEVVDYFKPGILPINFLFGPLLYFYVSSISIENFKFRRIHLFHIVPLLAVCLHRSTIDAVSISTSSNLAENPSFIHNKIYYILLILSMFIYWIFSVKLILNHRKIFPFIFQTIHNETALTG